MRSWIFENAYPSISWFSARKIFAKFSIPAAVIQRFSINQADGETPAIIVLTNEKDNFIKTSPVVSTPSLDFSDVSGFLIFNLQGRTQFLLLLNPYWIKIFKSKSNRLANLCTSCEILGKTLVDLGYFYVKINFCFFYFKKNFYSQALFYLEGTSSYQFHLGLWQLSVCR